MTMKKLLLGALLVTGLSATGCHHLIHHAHRRHVAHRRTAGAVAGAILVGAAVHHAAHHRHHHYETRTVVVHDPAPRRTVVYESDHCGY